MDKADTLPVFFLHAVTGITYAKHVLSTCQKDDKEQVGEKC